MRTRFAGLNPVVTEEWRHARDWRGGKPGEFLARLALVTFGIGVLAVLVAHGGLKVRTGIHAPSRPVAAR